MKSKKISYNKSRKTKKRTLTKSRKTKKRKNSKIIKGGKYVASGSYGSVYGYGSEEFTDNEGIKYMVGVPPFTSEHEGFRDNRYVCKIFISDTNKKRLQYECDDEYNFFNTLKLSPDDLIEVKKYSIVPEYKGTISSDTLNDVKYLNNWRTNDDSNFYRYLKPKKTIPDGDYPIIVSENGGIDLNKYLLLSNLLNQDTPLLQKIRIINILSGVKNLLEAIYFMSSRNIFHRDIKTSNVVTCILNENDADHNKNYKLIDWGLSGKITSPHSPKLESRIEDFYEIGVSSYFIFPPVCFGILYSNCLSESNTLDINKFIRFLLDNNNNKETTNFDLCSGYTNKFIYVINMFYNHIVNLQKFSIDGIHGYFQDWENEIPKILRQKTFGSIPEDKFSEIFSYSKDSDFHKRKPYSQDNYVVEISNFENIIKKYLKFYKNSENENKFDVDKILKSIDIYSFGILLVQVFNLLVLHLFNKIFKYADNNGMKLYSEIVTNQDIRNHFKIEEYIDLFDKVYQVIILCCYLPEEDDVQPLYSIQEIVSKYDEILHTHSII